jgi:PAS domain-containing protein
MRKPKSLGAQPVGHPAPSSGGDAAGTGPDVASLFQRLPWGVVVLDVHGTVRQLNQQAAAWWGIAPQDLAGQRLGPATAGTLPADLQQALQQVAGNPEQPSGEFFLPRHQQWIAMTSVSQADGWVVYWHAITAQKEAAQELRRVNDELAQRAADDYGALYHSMDEGFCILEVLYDAARYPVDFRHLDVNPAFEKHSGLRGALGKTLRELVPGIEPFWLEVYGRVALTGEPARAEEYVEALGRWFDINAFPIGPPLTRRVAVLFHDITERKRTEEALRQSEARYRSLFANMEQGFCLLEKVATPPREPSDYRYLAVNPAFARHSGLADAAGKTLRELVPGVEPRIVAIYDEVVASGASQRFEEHVAELNVWIEAEVVPDTHSGHLMVLFSNVSVRRRAEETLRQSEEQFRLLVTATSDTVYRMSADWTHMEQLLGKNFLADTLSPTRTWVEEYLPAEDLPQVQAAIATAIRDKSPFELEHRVRRADGTVGWTYSRAVPVLDARGELAGWLGAASDVSARKQAEEQLLAFTAGLEQQVAERTRALGESQVQLQSVFDSTTLLVALLAAVRDANGDLLDFEYVLANPNAQAYEPGRNLIGQRFAQLHPGVHHVATFGQLAAVVETGQRADFEVYYDHEGYHHWFRLMGVKVNDGVLFTAEDITARKLLEQAQTQSLALLQASEAVAGLGSWDYDLSTQEFTWSDGLYHLLGRPVGSAVSPQFLLDAVLDDDRPAAARLLRALATGTSRFDAPLRLRVGDAVKTVRVQAVPLPPAPGLPERVLGVCLDVTDVQRLEAENLALKLDRHKELLLGILQAQETERQRLGEVLHNGLGQVLYATKLRLDQLDTPALRALPALTGLHQQSARLLAEAMRQTRTLAHELVPTSLLHFGLAAAVGDICRDLSTPQLRVACHVWGKGPELPQPVQVTLFRLAQELAHNIVRHAGATQATLELETLPGWVSLRAEDNGRGFDPLTVATGLGLRTMRNAVALLGGTVAIDSSPEFGTHVRLRIPLPLFSLP